MELPLNGIRVFEFGGNVAAPYAAWILAEMGADVIKIERPEGDDARAWGPPFWKDTGTAFHSINRNKKSVTVDLKDPDAVSNLQDRIVEEGDVVIQNLRPGVAASLGFAPEPLLARNPRLVYCNLHAYGATGPLKDQPGYDALMQAFGGLMSVTGEEGQPPVRAGVSVIDMGTGMWCGIGILGALFRRQMTGQGGIVDTSLFETALGWMTYHALAFQACGELPGKQGTGTRGVVPYQGYECSDGYLIVAASNDRLFVKLAQVLGREEWLEDERFSANPGRVQHRAELNALLAPIFVAHPRAHWQGLLSKAGVPTAPIQTVDEVLAHPQTEALGIGQTVDGDSMRLFGLPLSFDGERPPLRHIAPGLGADNETFSNEGNDG